LPGATATPRAIGSIEGFASKGFTATIQIAPKDEDAKWKLELSAATAADAPKVTAFQKGIEDMLVVCHYRCNVRLSLCFNATHCGRLPRLSPVNPLVVGSTPTHGAN
jgi:hypothetical protein